MTVLDSRQLLFDEAAVRASLCSNNHVARQLRLPDGVGHLFLLADDQCLEYTPPADARGQTITRLSAAQVGALLIAYCIRSGIPVPRNCTKTIRIDPKQVALTFTNRIAAA